MKWFRTKMIYNSEFSGPIKVQRFLGRWSIVAGDCYQTSWYTLAMWRRALAKLPVNAKVKKILILGLGAGGNIKQIQRSFPSAQITAIELDPIMVAIAQQTFLSGVKHLPHIIIGDALVEIRKLRGTFDLILVDLFVGQQAADFLMADDFLQNLAIHLNYNGYLILNAYKQPQLIRKFSLIFSIFKQFKYSFNQLAIFQAFGHGNLGDRLPDDYFNYRANKEYLQRESLDKKRTLVGQDSCYGWRWHYGPFYVESYTCDNEPQVQTFNHPRLVIWQPITRLDEVKPWRRSWVMMNSRKTGFAPISFQPDYWNVWTKHAQRQRAKWLKNPDYNIRERPVEEFIANFKKVRKTGLLGIKNSFINFLQLTRQCHGDLVHCYLAYDNNQEVVGGLAVLDLPEVKQSRHLISFLLSAGEPVGAGVGLIDYWYQQLKNKDYKYIDYGVFWSPHKPRSWQGFSRFKAQFGTRYITYPNPLMRWVRKGKK
jgi:hypothetical protein